MSEPVKDKGDESATIEEMLNVDFNDPMAAATGGITNDTQRIPQQGLSNWQRIIQATSPPKSIESYADHPLNFDSTPSTGRIIRGSEGIIGDLDKAVVDIIIGLIEKGQIMYADMNRTKQQELIT
jgi:hypothetical protein